MQTFESFSKQLDLQTGVLEPVECVIQRRLSDMRNIYIDEEARERIEREEGDRLIYEVFVTKLPEKEGHLSYGTTIIYPGCVGEEFHITKGHFHKLRNRAEVYIGISGEGCLIMQSEDGSFRSLKMKRGTVAYVPPNWAHRTGNIGNEPFSFFAIWPGDAGHDYGAIERSSFAKVLVVRGGQAVLIDNPKYAQDK